MCLTCEALITQTELVQAPYERGLEEYPPEWQNDFKRLSGIIFTLADRYNSGILIRIWDPRSFQGLLKSIRHGIRRYPTFLVNKRTKLVGWDTELLDQLIRMAGVTPQA